MSTAELIARLKALGVRLWVDAGELKVQAPKGALDAELRAALASKKDELLALFAPRPEHDARGPAGGGSIARVARTGHEPLSFAQKRLWFLQQLEPSLSAYNIPLNWNLRGPLDVALLERCLTEILARHESMRTVFPERGGVPAQVVLEPTPVRLRLVRDESGRPHAAWRREVLRLMTADAETAFDLAQGPLYRPTLYRLKQDEHVLCVCVHHSIFDGVSIGVFLSEMIASYEALLAGRTPLLPTLPVQYVDYAVWQQGWFETPEFRRELAYWRRTLSGKLPVLELPTDHPRPPIQTYHGDREELTLAPELVQRLEALGKAEGATLFMVMLSVYALLLRRYTGQTDLLIGTAINGRDRPEVEGLIGFFVNTLVIRIDASGEPTFRALLARVRDACLGAYEHHSIPFERLVDELQPERNLSYSPVFQTLFLNELDPDPPKTMGDIVIRPHGKEEDLEFHIARNDLCFWVSADEDELIAWAEYNTDLFDAATIERLLGHYVELCGSALAQPERPVAELELLPAAEREALLVGWSRRGEPFAERAVHTLFHEQVARTPEALAVLFPSLADPARDERLSYRELEQRASRLARHLVARGVRPGQLVGVCVERSSAMLVTLLAILETGAAYVPLDPSYPAERLLYMASDARLALVVTHGALDRLFAPLLEGAALAVCHLEREAEAIAGRSPEPTGIAVGARERMYVIYTSGSTGKPKGVQIEHRSVANFLCSMQREPGLAAGELFLALTTPSFDISVLELFLPLLVGAAVAIAPAAATADGAALSQLIERLQPDVLQATPASWRLLLLAGWRGSPAKLRAYSGGEALARELADELCARTRSLWNLYGPTEATIWSTLARVEPGGGPVSIGRPIANTRVHVLDPSLQPVPLGVTGELWIAGDGLARGYLERPELDRERFVADPFVAGARMYRTGDLARWRLATDGAGELECLGRVDQQVKLRGFRIELGEVESVLCEVEGVRECVAIVREDTPGDQRLVAYFTRAPAAQAVEVGALRAAARAHLPAYMVPALYQELEALPLTPNGKVDRKALHALENQAPALEREHVPPRNATEETIARVWSQVLGLEAVTVNTNFFDLGGHSLLLAQVHARLLEHFPAIGILELFQFPTVSALAEHLLGGARDTAEDRDERKKGLAAGREALLQRRRVRR